MILADTHAWLWWINEDPRLSARAKSALDRQPVAICAISMWEVAQLAAKGRLRLQDDAETWLKGAISRPDFHVLELTPAVCVTGAGFGERLLRDPADRLIAATGLTHGIALVTADDAITASGLVRTVW